ncbi:DUF3572 domain-containing protein [Pararhodobacter zhoushanensis]|uniref:DUF3572 domain-containing protein n=1 Tax=Pararhodobacter zhoushanensis TaxID=2479545 RepID=A0ABT3GYE6_9RHOB|nr:DUF3572 domain-containing protein [Pararhodobacter zhoushanensis]MCW1932553.1 DUF3572 domain-containing protein [Pararhodobacter zhoushanensis]
MTRQTAETFAAQVLAWLADDNARITGFLSWSGESPSTLAARLTDPGFLLAVIEFLMTDEALLIDACAALGYPPETPLQARSALPGGADFHWT